MSGRNYTRLRERIEQLPEAKAREYLAELDGLLSCRDAQQWDRFEFKLKRAEWLAGKVHTTPARRIG